ncbi:hypothetical protein GCM10023187_05700 [Nibrella viscosa]|uniref:Cation/H+ exchanger transmembrane domain-containing protein n=2 Tax=Nibrella viscosa TaxID=1084524 RepID=A0ABP8JVZ4_9BACT
MVFNELLNNLENPSAKLFLQIAVIMALAQLVGLLLKKIRQPLVIGEIIAGILLGPSVLGLVAPGISRFLFPASSLPGLQSLSQIGLILFMFIIGLELDVNQIRKMAYPALVISYASILVPFGFGMLLAYPLYGTYAPSGTTATTFALFMGTAMSITAFPVLAKILHERQLTRTVIGSLALLCAAFNDLTAWCVLGAVVAIAKAKALAGLLVSLLLLVLYLLAMFLGGRPLLRWVFRQYADDHSPQSVSLVVTFLLLLLSCYATEIIGVHALFGAFVAGVIMPPNTHLRTNIAERINDISRLILLPLFFVLTGLKTKINLLDTPQLWLVTALIILVAIAGKLGGCALAARYSRYGWPFSLQLGVLMNARGFMELVVLNIGYDLGIISPTLFAMMVLMALITTLITGPALNIIARYSPQPTNREEAIPL